MKNTKKPTGDAECIHCGEMHDSFGVLPLCPTCTRAHAAALPEIKGLEGLEGIENLRRAVKMFNACNESFNQRFGAHGLINIYEALLRSEWDIYPDRWTPKEINDALAGRGTGATYDR